MVFHIFESSVHLTYPSPSLFKFPPAPHPRTLPPPVSISERFMAVPFSIPTSVYNDLLDVSYPITVALVYVTFATILNQINRQRGNKPWAISKTRIFFTFVILHNIFLAIFSGFTFVGMLQAVQLSWPGWNRETGLAEVVDACCKIHGPRGLGDAVTYNTTMDIWDVSNRAINLTPDGLPDVTDVGRIWNEGLAFWGWFFYISKFYEVLDTAIILAKGKRSSFLQTYHHTGAMFCMWAGIRYMAPPIWLFVLLNSGIHTMMYTYYALCALTFSVPQFFKRTITTLQITQLVVGTLFALAHLFVSYDIPVSVPYTFLRTISSSVSSAMTSVATAAASAGIGGVLKKLALRAGGQEGLAENVHNRDGQIFGQDAINAAHYEKSMEETRYRVENQTIPCVDNSGVAFAIWLNVIYFLPLTWLFVKFFAQAYHHRISSSAKHPTKTHTLEKSGKDALKGVERELDEAVKESEGGPNGSEPGGKESEKSPADNLKALAEDIKAKLENGEGTESEEGNPNKGAADNLRELAKEIKAKLENGEGDEKAKDGGRPDEGMADKVHELAEAVKANIGDAAQKDSDALDDDDSQAKKDPSKQESPKKSAPKKLGPRKESSKSSDSSKGKDDSSEQKRDEERPRSAGSGKQQQQTDRPKAQTRPSEPNAMLPQARPDA